MLQILKSIGNAYCICFIQLHSGCMLIHNHVNLKLVFRKIIKTFDSQEFFNLKLWEILENRGLMKSKTLNIHFYLINMPQQCVQCVGNCNANIIYHHGWMTLWLMKQINRRNIGNLLHPQIIKLFNRFML